MLTIIDLNDDVINMILAKLNQFKDFINFYYIFSKLGFILDIDNYIINNRYNLDKLLQSQLSKVFIENTKYEFRQLTTQEFIKKSIIPIWKSEVFKYSLINEYNYESVYDYIIDKNDIEGFKFLMNNKTYISKSYTWEKLEKLNTIKVDNILKKYEINNSFFFDAKEAYFCHWYVDAGNYENFRKYIITRLTRMSSRNFITKLIKLNRKEMLEILIKSDIKIILENSNFLLLFLKIFDWNLEIVFRDTIIIGATSKICYICLKYICEKNKNNSLDSFIKWSRHNFYTILRLVKKYVDIMKIIDICIDRKNYEMLKYILNNPIIDVYEIEYISRDFNKLQVIFDIDDYRTISLFWKYIDNSNIIKEKCIDYIAQKDIKKFEFFDNFINLKRKTKEYKIFFLYRLIHFDNLSLINHIFEKGFIYIGDVDMTYLKTYINFDEHKESKKLLQSKKF
jgi:hypothetical protein